MSWEVAKVKDKFDILKFIMEMNDSKELIFDNYPKGLTGTFNYMFDKGKVLYHISDTSVDGCLGYLDKKLIDPSSQSIGYIYFAVIGSKKRTFSKTFLNLVKKTTEELFFDGFKRVQFKAYKSDSYTNNLYSKIANPIKEENNSEGIQSILYDANIGDWKRRFL